MQSEQINELVSALSKAQGIMNGAMKDSKNPYYDSKYADLNSVWTACREALSKNGLAVIQVMQNVNDQLMLVTTLGHSSGQWMKSFLPINISSEPEVDKYGKPKKKNQLHALGSALTYLRRYALAAIVGVAPDEDDDGNEVNKAYEKKKSEPAKEQVQTKSDSDEYISDLQLEILSEVLQSNMEFHDELIQRFGSLSKIPFKFFDRIMVAVHKRKEESQMAVT